MLSVIVCILSLVVLASVGYSYILSLRIKKLEIDLSELERKLIFSLETLKSTPEPKPKTTRKPKT